MTLLSTQGRKKKFDKMKTNVAAAAALVLPALAGADAKPLVSSKALQNKIKLKDLMSGSQKLQDFANANGGTRVFGSGGHNATVDWLVESLEALDYYDVVKQPFTELFATGSAAITVDGAPLEANIMTYTPGGSGTGQLVKANNLGCAAEDYPVETEGNVAFISRGSCTFAQKSISARAAGAIGAIIYNNVPGSLSGTLGDPFQDYAPVVGIAQEDSVPLLEKLGAGETVTVDFDVDAIVEERVNFNVIAETKGGDHDNVLVIGGHTDSVAAGPGINDDGSGTVGVLRVAEALAKFKINNAVRLGFWSAEEYGLLGSYYYVNSINGSETELAKIRAYLNFDMIASPNYIYGVYDGDGSAFNLTGPPGSAAIEKEFEDFFRNKGANSVPTEFSGRSDYAAFIENGIPSGGLFTGAEQLKTPEEAVLFGGEAGVAYDVNYHLEGDDIANLNKEAYLLNTKAIAHTVATYALSWDTIEDVDLTKRRWAADRAVFAKRTSDGKKHRHSGPCGGADSK
jgi:Zn-dependent M28 family amino/carboxypeptidase